MRLRGLGARSVLFGALLFALLHAQPVCAQSVVYAISIGNNQPLASDTRLAELRYADDDALRYYALLSRAAAHADLLTVLDATTQQRHRALPSTLSPPTLDALRRSVLGLTKRVAADRAAGREPVVFVTFSGHGGTLPSGESYLALLDGPLTRSGIESEIITKLPGARVHLIVDACNAAAVVGVRGPFDREVEAERVELTNAQTSALIEHGVLQRYPNVGALLASSEAQETHEWSRIEGGVFTHIVLSALLGAADINGDLSIEYSEVQAFVSAAQSGVADPRARPRLVAYPPLENPRATLLALRSLRDTVLLTGQSRGLGHFYVELQDGTRWLDAHLDTDLPFVLALPSAEVSYLRTQEREGVLRAAPDEDVLALSKIDMRPRSMRARGSVDAALERGLFSDPYGRAYYVGFADSQGLLQVDFGAPRPVLIQRDGSSPIAQRTWAGIAWAVGGAAAIAAGVTLALSLDAKADFDETDRQRAAADAKQRAEDFRLAAATLGGVALAGAATGGVLWWTANADPVQGTALLVVGGKILKGRAAQTHG